MLNNYSGSIMPNSDICRGTADDHMWPMIQAKLEVLGKVGLTRETFGGMEERNEEMEE